MKEYVLSYYSKFKCIAGACKHTCCAGWEMNIDKQSLENYLADRSSFSSVLKSGINVKKSRFKADKSGRCAFLNDKGLCDIIINLGEECLCQVCRDHPRFRAFFSDRVETGLGFSCEEACKIILSFKDKIEPVLISDDGDETALDFTEQNVVDFRKKALDIIQDRSLLIDDRISSLLKECKAEILDKDILKAIKRFLSFERVDKTFTKRLKNLKKVSINLHTGEDYALYAEQFLANALYRHLYDAEDTMWVRARTIACVISWWIVKNIIESETGENEPNFELIVDIIRDFSTEVEYSQDNLDKLYDFAYKFIKI